MLTAMSGVPILSDLIALPPLDAKPRLRNTPLDAMHQRLGARMVAFAGWSMPVQYPANGGGGTLAEHQAVRTAAGLFDVSHMGQVRLSGAGAAAILERLVPADIQALKPNTQRYTMFTNEAGGILDDIMVANHGDHLELVINAARADADIAHLRSHLDGTGITLTVHENRALLALQGPAAAPALGALVPAVASMPFMGVTHVTIAGAPCWLTRSGYTGEDGYEISIPGDDAERVAEALLAQPGVVPAGLAARDTLRLEAGLCLYGNDIDELTTPVEAGLTWSIGKRRRVTLDFPGAAVIADQLAHGVTRRRVGLRLAGRALARAGAEIAAPDATLAGTITSGSFSPSLGSPIAMGYVRRDLAAESTELGLLIRGQRHPARVVPLPFVPHRFAR